ncbi:MAG: N-acetyl-gamma-glutamyl-phosphate reductase [Alphaproteobacteria bacterium]|nr:N-acetyl-gamma-glutamyl-phosphate reductase [Alphaproteobacteria bacterium]
MSKIRVSIIGITGYTGLELLRLLLAHPAVEIAHLTSRQHENTQIGTLYPHLAHLDLAITNTSPEEAARDSDVVFLALPHKTAQDVVASLHGKVKLIDLSADYRLDDAEIYEKYYGIPHNHPTLLQEVVYGLPETVGRAPVTAAQSIANPGCFSLLSQLLLFPFKGRIKRANIVAVTGSSGAGKSPGEGTHHPVRNHNMKSYNINGHRHIPEIIRAGDITAEQLNFVPTSGPFTRGIFATAFIELKDAEARPPAETARAAYKGSPFIRIMPNGEAVALANVTGSNFTDLSFQSGADTMIIAQGVLDNLVKGAAGTAIQNMNLMFGLPETDGLLNLSPLYP